MRNAVYITENGEEHNIENLERKEKCAFCGTLGDIQSEHLDGEMPNVHGESFAGDVANICRECLVNGVDEEKLNEEIGSTEEIKKEIQGEEVEL